MFIRYFLELPLPAEQVEAVLLGPAARWLEGLATDAGRRSEGLLAEVQVGPLGPHLARPVRIHLGDPARLASTTSLPMSWEPVGETLLPKLEADLEVGALGPARTQLAIGARYRPPLGRLGRVADRVLLHRVAEATVKDFPDRVGEAVQAAVEATAPPTAAVAA
jgi:hypothetical protein